jgi:thiamine pyrophosphokinase
MAPVHVLVFAGGDPPPRGVRARLPADAMAIAADSGLRHAQALGRAVDLVVGDLDSVDPAALDRARAAGATVEAHPADKDATDLELALDAALARGATAVSVIGGHGGRVDHFVANLLLLASPTLDDVAVDAWVGTAHVTVITGGGGVVAGPPGSLCTLLAVGGPALGVTTSGLRFALRDDALLPGSSRGVSNELTEPEARITVADGRVLAIQPDALPADRPPANRPPANRPEEH